MNIEFQLTIQIVHFEEENEFFVWSISGELVHGVDEFCHGNAAILVTVEDPEGSLHEERLEKVGTI